MKDKRKYLKFAFLIEIIYIICSLIYLIVTFKTKDELIATIFLNSISLFFSFVLLSESKKDIKYLKENKGKIIISSIWLLFDILIPGILGFRFLKSLKEKRVVNLPSIKKDITKKDKIKSILAILIFLIIMFVLPEFDFFEKIPKSLIYIVIFTSIVGLNFNYLINNFKVFIKNLKLYLPFIIKKYFKMLGLLLLVGVPIVLLNNGNTSGNQSSINELFKKLPLITFILTTFYAPIVEELVFRLNFSNLIKNDKLFILVSGFVFGLMHVIGNFSNFQEFLYVFQYSVIGICLAKAYNKTNNIFVSIAMHFMQNFLASVLVLLLF